MYVFPLFQIMHTCVSDCSVSKWRNRLVRSPEQEPKLIRIANEAVSLDVLMSAMSYESVWGLPYWWLCLKMEAKKKSLKLVFWIAIPQQSEMLCLRFVVLVLNYLLGFGAVTAYVDRQRPINFGSSHQSSSQGSQAQNSKCVSETFKICKVRNKIFLDFSNLSTFLFALELAGK